MHLWLSMRRVQPSFLGLVIQDSPYRTKKKNVVLSTVRLLDVPARFSTSLQQQAKSLDQCCTCALGAVKRVVNFVIRG